MAEKDAIIEPLNETSKEDDQKEPSTSSLEKSTLLTDGDEEKGANALKVEDYQDYEEEDGIELTEDIYSLMYTSKIQSTAFFYALGCNVFQYIFIVLVLVDVLTKSDANNPFNLPPGVPLQVTIGQGLALLLALAMQDDLLTGIVYLHQGHRCSVGGEELPGATAAKWYFAALTQLLAGAGLNFVIFVLVMQSSDIIGMFLNFAALMFISEIDDIGFKLADNGFIGCSLQLACQDVRKVKLSVSKETNTIYRSIIFAIMACLLYLGYGILVSRQLHGKYLCNRVLIQLGDDFGTAYAPFSGVYKQTNLLIDQRVTYTEERRSEGERAGHIGYCSSENAWTLYIDESKGPCEWLARSPDSNSFDVTTTNFENWLTKNTETKQTLAYSAFYLDCIDCNENICDVSQGTCDENVCICKPGFYGVSCEFEEPCEVLTVDLRTNDFPLLSEGEQVVPPDTFQLRRVDGKIATEYNKPVYTSESTFFGSRYALIFTGRRYAMIYSVGNQFRSPMETENALFTGSYHAFFDSPVAKRTEDENNLQYDFIFLSEPLDVGTSSHKLTPEGLAWSYNRGGFDGFFDDTPQEGPVFPDGLIDTDTTLLCALCDEDTNPCLNDGECNNSTYQCECFDIGFLWRTPGSIGALCELPKSCNEVGCYEGTCDERSGKCLCPVQFTGTFCEYDQDCSVTGCMGGGICDFDSGNCRCPDFRSEGYFEFCGTNGNCRVNGCLNGGTCGDSGLCECPLTHRGAFCEEEWDCGVAEFDCSIGGGTCNPLGFCDCPAYSTGRFCEIPKGCNTLGCIDGGTCNSVTGKCECPPDEPEREFCTQSGNCTTFGCNDVGNCTDAGFCECPWIWEGAFCQW